MRVGDRLRDERKSLGVSQASLAASCGVRRQSQVEFEKGTHIPGGEYLIAAAAHDIDVRYVLTGERGIQRVHEPLDRGLLEDCIAAIEKFLRDAGRRMQPGPKAALIIEVYAEFRARGGATRANVLEFIQRAA